MRKLAVQCAAGGTVTNDNQNTGYRDYVGVKCYGNSELSCRFRVGIRLSILILGVKLAGEFGKTPIHCASANNRLSMLNSVRLDVSPHFYRAG